MLSRLRAVDNNLPQLLAILDRNDFLVTEISGACQAKGILYSEIHQNVLQSSKPRRDKAFYLVSEIWKVIRQDEEKCELFIQVLRRHGAFSVLAEKITKDTKELDSHSGPNAITDHYHDPFPMSLTIREWMQARVVTTPTPETCKVSNRAPSQLVTGDCFTGRRHINAEDHHNAEMDRAQNIALINALRAQIDALQRERREVQASRNREKVTKTALENRLKEVVRHLERITTEKDNLKDSSELLKGKVAQVQKSRYADKKKVENLISDYEDQIKTLKNEKQQLQIEIEVASQQYEKSQFKADLVETINMNCNFRLEDVQQQVRGRQLEYEILDRKCAKYEKCILVLALLIISLALLCYYGFTYKANWHCSTFGP